MFAAACLPFLPNSHIYDYGENFEFLKIQLNVLDAAQQSSNTPEYCQGVLRAYVCNYAYPGCNTMNGEPRGICEEDCITVSTGECKTFFNNIPVIAGSAGFVFDPRCDNTLINLQTVYNQNFTYNSQDCTSVQGNLLLNPKLAK